MKIARNAAIMACDELGDKFEKFVEMAVQFFFFKSLKSLKVYMSSQNNNHLAFADIKGFV